MKLLKKSICIVLALMMVLTLGACHSKDEVALTIEGIDIKTGLYLNALVDCDSDARAKVDEQLANKESDSSSTEETDYYAQQIDGLDYKEYVEMKTLERCKEFALYQKLANDGVIKLTDEELANAADYATNYWNSYGYGYLYGENGISVDTFKQVMIYSAYSNAYFMHIYGKGGEKEVAAETIKKNMLDNYALAYVLPASYPEGVTADAKAALKTKLEGFGKRLQKGEDFLKIYNELNGTNEKAPEKTKDGPKNVYARPISEADSTDFDDVYEMKVGDYKVFETEDKTGLTLYVRLDINSDSYYLTSLNDTILIDLKQDEFDKMIKETLADFKVEENSWALDRIDVEDIDYSAYQEFAAASQQYSY